MVTSVTQMWPYSGEGPVPKKRVWASRRFPKLPCRLSTRIGAHPTGSLGMGDLSLPVSPQPQLGPRVWAGRERALLRKA